MNWDIVEANWPQFKGKLKAEWGRLTDTHLDLIAGRRRLLVGEIQEHYGISHDEAEAQIVLFESRNEDSRPT
jgi:uncharacterized protein YjbJ (UPF0337 family)